MALKWTLLTIAKKIVSDEESVELGASPTILNPKRMYVSCTVQMPAATNLQTEKKSKPQFLAIYAHIAGQQGETAHVLKRKEGQMEAALNFVPHVVRLNMELPQVRLHIKFGMDDTSQVVDGNLFETEDLDLEIGDAYPKEGVLNQNKTELRS